MPPQRILAPYKLFNLFCGNHFILLFRSFSFCGSGGCFFVRPGLPRCRLQWEVRRFGERRPLRLQLVIDGQQYQWHELDFRRDVAHSQHLGLPRLRFSVALPLGINRGDLSDAQASLCPAGAPTGRFIRVFFALLAGRRPRRAVPSGSKLAPRADALIGKSFKSVSRF